MATKILLKTVEKLENDEIEDINDFLISNGKGIMNTKDRKAMLEYWLKIAKENEQFFNFLEDLFTRIDEPVAAAALSQMVNKRIVYSVDTSKKCLQQREYNNHQELLYAPSKHDNTCQYYLIALVVSLLVACSVLLILVLLIMLPNSPGVFTLSSTSTQIVVAENDTVIVGKYSSNNIAIKISELILHGDAEHRCNVLAVSSSLLMYRYKTEYKMFKQTTIVDNQPVLNEIYVYLLSGSQVENEVCLGNVSGSPNATLYGYNNENEFNNYASSSIVGMPTFQQSFVVGSPGHIICVNVTFVIQKSDYYFFMLKLPKQGTTYRYKTTAKEKYLNYKDYLTNNTICTVSNGHDCTLQLSTTSESTVLVYTVPHIGIGSKINHLDIKVSFFKLNTTLTLVCLLGSSVFVIVIIIILFVAMYFFCRRLNKSKRVWKGFTYEKVSTDVN